LTVIAKQLYPNKPFESKTKPWWCSGHYHLSFIVKTMIYQHKISPMKRIENKSH